MPVVRDALGPLLDVPGVFVLGSNDYFAPTLRNPLRYLLPDNGKRHTHTPQLPWPELKRHVHRPRGWLDLTNRRGSLRVGDLDLAFAGVDDPHLSYDRLDDGRRAGRRRRPTCASPSPTRRTCGCSTGSRPTARTPCSPGHTHGGQVLLPGARRADHQLRPRAAPGPGACTATRPTPRPGDPGSAWLHVSAGLGTNPYVRVRVACRPEATLLTPGADRPLRPGVGRRPGCRSCLRSGMLRCL